MLRMLARELAREQPMSLAISVLLLFSCCLAELLPTAATPSPTSLSLITPAPSVQEVLARGLIDIPQFCGFNYFDSAHGPWNCIGGSTCYYNTDLTGVGCCSSGYCNYATACIPSTEISTASSRYQGQPWVLTCSNSQEPICVVASFDTSFFSYTCATSFLYYSIVLTSPGSGTTPPITGTKRITGGTTPLSPSIASSTSSPSSSASGSTSGNGQTNTGAIVGGVVGGVAGVAFTTLLIWWLITRSRRKSNQTHQGNSGHTSMRAKSELDSAIINEPHELGGMSATHKRTVELPET